MQDEPILPDNPNAEFIQFSHRNALQTTSVAVGPDGYSLAIGCENAGGNLQVRLWDLRTGDETKRFGLPCKEVGSAVGVCFSANGRILASTHYQNNGDTKTFLWSIETGELLFEFPYGGHVSFSPSESVIVVADIRTYEAHLVRVIDAEKGTVLKTLDLLKRGPLAGQVFEYPRFVRFSQDGKHIHFCYGTISGTWNPTNDHLQVHSDHFGKSAPNIGVHEPRYFCVNTTANLAAITDNAQSPVVLVDLQNGREVRRLPKNSYCAWGLGFCNDDSSIWYCSDDHVVVANIRDGAELRRILVGNDHRVILHPNERFLISATKYYGVCIRDFETGQRVAQLTPVLAPRCWFTRIPNTGDWHSPEEAQRVFPDQVNDSGGKPAVIRILQHYLRSNSQDVEGRIQWKMATNGQAIQITNGTSTSISKVLGVSGDQSQLLQAPPKGTTETIDLRVPEKLRSRRKVRTIALMEDGTFAGTNWLIDSKGEFNNDPEFRRLFILSVGVSKHHFAEYDLDFAARDAEQLTALLQRQRGATFDDVQVVGCLLNEKASLESIRGALQLLATQSGANDTVLLFFAGHGLKGRRGLYLFLHEGDVDSISTTCANWAEIAESLGKCRAGKILLIADCCHAGAFSNEHFLTQKQLAATFQSDERIHVLMAGTGEELSVEAPDRKHGLFTSVLLDGLSGQADVNADSATTLSEVAKFVAETVPKLSNNAQHPQASWKLDRSDDEILTIHP